eukprot:m.18547 g.18547  ORF g.18547 m.18547 type:complete len:518 (+) comp5327_c0_seq1:82-1635(+)
MLELVEEGRRAGLVAANTLLSACGLPPFLSSILELQPVVVLSLIERLVGCSFGGATGDSVAQCQAALDHLATSVLEVPRSALSHLSADKLDAGDTFAIVCLIELLERLCDPADLAQAAASLGPPQPRRTPSWSRDTSWASTNLFDDEATAGSGMGRPAAAARRGERRFPATSDGDSTSSADDSLADHDARIPASLQVAFAAAEGAPSTDDVDADSLDGGLDELDGRPRRDDAALRRAPNNADRDAALRAVLGNARAAAGGRRAASKSSRDNGHAADPPAPRARATHSPLIAEFSDIVLDEHTDRWLKKKFAHKLRAVTTRPRRGGRPVAAKVEQVARTEEARVARLRKEANAAERREAHAQEQAQLRAVRRSVYEKRRENAALRQHYREFHSAQLRRLQRGKSKAEQKLRDALETSITEYAEEIHDARVYAKQKQAEYANIAIDRLESITRWYRDQFELLDQELRAVQTTPSEDANNVRRLEAARRALAHKLKRKVQQLQADAASEADLVVFDRGVR